MLRHARAYHQRAQAHEAGLAQNETLVLKTNTGIDALGRLVETSPPHGDEHIITFLLHGKTLTKDLEFWSRVAVLLSKEHPSRLVAYCDGKACVHEIAEMKPYPNFSVIAYGQIVSTQAVINADARGNSIIQIGTGLGLRTVPWRTEAQTPEGFVSVVFE